MIFTEPTHQQVTQSLTDWGLGNFRSMHHLSAGSANSNFRVERINDTPLVLRICDECSPDVAQRIAEQTVWVARHGICTAAPIATHNGDLTRINAGSAWLWMPYISGAHLDLNPTSLFALGQLMAKLHLIPKPENLPNDLAVGFNFIKQVFLQADCNTAILKRLRNICVYLQNAIPDDLPRCLIHGDIHGENIIVKNGKVLTLLDFESICYDWRALDLGMALSECGRNDTGVILSHWQALVQGYDSITPLTAAEWKALPDLARYADLANCMWRYKQFYILHTELNQRNHYLELAKRFDMPIPTSAMLMDKVKF